MVDDESCVEPPCRVVVEDSIGELACSQQLVLALVKRHGSRLRPVCRSRKRARVRRATRSSRRSTRCRGVRRSPACTSSPAPQGGLFAARHRSLRRAVIVAMHKRRFQKLARRRFDSNSSVGEVIIAAIDLAVARRRVVAEIDCRRRSGICLTGRQSSISRCRSALTE